MAGVNSSQVQGPKTFVVGPSGFVADVDSNGRLMTTGSGGSGAASGLSIASAGTSSPTPVFSPNEGPSTINPSMYVQDTNGNWHQQAGIDTTTTWPGAPPSGPTGTLAWLRRMYFRDTAANTQTAKNGFLSINHATGVGEAQAVNQDRALVLQTSNYTGVITHIQVVNNVLTFALSSTTSFGGTAFAFVPGQIVSPQGLSVGTTLNNGQFLVTSATTTQVNAVPFPLAIVSVANASGATTVYTSAGGITGGTSNGLVGVTFVVSGCSHSANNGTFTCTASSQNTLTLSNTSGVLETAPAGAQALGTYADASTADSGNLDQWIYGMEGIQSEIDVSGTPHFTGSPDSEISAGSFQTGLNLTGVVTSPNQFGANGVRISLSKSNVGYITGSSLPYFALYSQAFINNPTDIHSGGMIGGYFRAFDQSTGAPNGVGHGVYIANGNRMTTVNHGLHIEDFGPAGHNAYPISSVANAVGGNTVYTGTFPTAGTLNGATFIISGLSNPANNGTFQCASNTSTTLTLVNPNGIAETHAGSVIAILDYALYSAGGRIFLGGTIANYNGVVTAGNGMTAIYGALDLTGQSNSINTTTLFSVPASGAGMYRVSYSLIDSVAGSGGTVTVTIGNTNPTGGNTQTSSPLSLTGSGELSGSFTMYSAGAQNITYATTVLSPIGSPKYDIHLRVEAI